MTRRRTVSGVGAILALANNVVSIARSTHLGKNCIPHTLIPNFVFPHGLRLACFSVVSSQNRSAGLKAPPEGSNDERQKQSEGWNQGAHENCWPPHTKHEDQKSRGRLDPRRLRT